jgi:lipopolysaccharide export system protein LptC
MSRSIWLGLLLIGAACFSTILMLKNTNHQQPQPLANPSRHPDAFMINASYYEYDAQGLLHSHLFTPKVLHFKFQNSAQFIHPNFMIYTDKTQSPWYITANHGISRDGVNWVYLWDNVQIHQPQQPDNLPTNITTDNVTIFPNQSVAQTEEDVTISRPDSIVKARGMQTNFKTGVVELLSHSRGIYAASSPATESKQPKP